VDYKELCRIGRCTARSLSRIVNYPPIAIPCNQPSPWFGYTRPEFTNPPHRRTIAMSDLASRFQTAVEDSKKLGKRPDNDTMLKLYARFKQGSSGDVEGKRPGFADLVGRAKYDAWAKLKGTAQEDAMQQYIDLVESLKNA